MVCESERGATEKGGQVSWSSQVGFMVGSGGLDVFSSEKCDIISLLTLRASTSSCQPFVPALGSLALVDFMMMMMIT